ncbi:MAG: hypothetical protein KC609_15655 [Myxococcales bacterium]|nr:hypothetical protein [Myxococcales bacterium]
MKRSISGAQLALFVLIMGAIVALVTVATVQAWGISRSRRSAKRLYNPSVRHHGVIYYTPGQRYRGFYDGGPGVGK